MLLFFHYSCWLLAVILHSIPHHVLYALIPLGEGLQWIAVFCVRSDKAGTLRASKRDFVEVGRPSLTCFNTWIPSTGLLSHLRMSAHVQYAHRKLPTDYSFPVRAANYYSGIFGAALVTVLLSRCGVS